MHLTTDQAQQVHDRLRPTLGYLSKLERRLRELRCHHRDPLFAKVTAAQQAMQDLVMELHYESGGHGVASRREPSCRGDFSASRKYSLLTTKLATTLTPGI